MNNQRSGRLLSDSEAVRKSVKHIALDPKLTPKKVYLTSSKERDPISARYQILRKKDKQMNSQQIQEHVLNSKLLEPLIEENIKRRNNTTKKRGKANLEVEEINYNDFTEIKNVKENFQEGPSYPEFNLNDMEADLTTLKNNVTVDFAEDEEISAKTSKRKFGKEKRFSVNKNEPSEELVGEDPQDNNLYQIKPPHDLKTNDTINLILNQTDKKTKLTSYFSYSKSKSRVNTQIASKVKGTKTSKRKIDNLTMSDEEKVVVTSKKRKNIR